MKFKILLFSLFSLIVSFSCGQAANGNTQNPKYHNLIDDISRAEQIKDLITSIDKRYADFRINADLKFGDKDCQKLCDSLKIKCYSKADFDHNGYTDLIVIGEWNDETILCVLDSGGNRFFINRLTRRNFQDCAFPEVDTSVGATIINYYHFRQKDWTVGDSLNTIEAKKLIYKFGDFIENNASPKVYGIRKIEYKTTMCFGNCPVFNLSINADRTAKYEAIRFNKPDGKFRGQIDQKSYSELVDLLNYIDFPNLKNDYKVDWTDDQTCILTITYDNGKVKQIRDYGLLGTYGLNRIYNLLFSFRKTQQWD